jgi:excisionase family DNA binding protein
MERDTTVLAIEHIVRTPGVCGGDARIAGRRITVHFLANVILRHGASVEEVAEDYDLRPSQIYAALAYYYDHQEEMDELVATAEELSDEATSELQELARSREWNWLGTDPDREMTVAEVAKTYGVKPVTVRRAIYDDLIPARKSGGTWLISLSDAEARWGHRRAQSGC